MASVKKRGSIALGRKLDGARWKRTNSVDMSAITGRPCALWTARVRIGGKLVTVNKASDGTTGFDRDDMMAKFGSFEAMRRAALRDVTGDSP